MAEQKYLAYNRLLEFENALARRGGRGRLERYARNYEYYTGDNAAPDDVEQPLGINYAQSINNKHTHYLFGQWEDDIVGWQVEPVVEEEEPSEEAKKKAQAITRYCYQLARKNRANSLFFLAGLNASIYGDAILRLRWDEVEQRVVWESVLPEFCLFQWAPDDMNSLREAIITYPIPRSAAYHQYGTEGNPLWGMHDPNMYGMAVYWEYWSPLEYQIWIDDQIVINTKNPYVRELPDKKLLPGIIPLIHIPNIRAGGEFYGFADAEPMFLLQDELNRKMADQGDIINSYAHPITVINKFYGDVQNLPVGPDQVWDLGRDGEAKLLTWEGTPPAVKEYVEKIMEIILDTASMSQVSYGRHKGSQQSAIALAVEMLPVTERATWKRMHWGDALNKLIYLSAFIEERRGKKLPFGSEEILDHALHPQWAPILPRDRQAEINENIAMVQSFLKSRADAIRDLGDPEAIAQWEKITSELGELIAMGVKLTGTNAVGAGSSSLPEGASKGTLKGRPQGSTKS